MAPSILDWRRTVMNYQSDASRSAVNAWKRVKRAARLAGITDIPVSPHFLRHSHGTHALRRGADLATVRDTLSHASIATTSRYLHARRRKKASGDYLAM